MEAQVLASLAMLFLRKGNPELIKNKMCFIKETRVKWYKLSAMK